MNVRFRRFDHIVATFLLTALILSGWLVIPQAQPTALAAGTPTPVATLAVPPDPFIGEDFTFTVTFDNTDPTATGYGPFVDLYLPVRGADGASGTNDGITFVSATYLGAPVTATTLTFDAGGNIAGHPYARNSAGASPTYTGTPEDQIVVLQLPFGSFTPAQPAATIVVTAHVSNLADLGTALNIAARAGFRYGMDPLDNPTTDPTIYQGTTAINTNPIPFPVAATGAVATTTPTLVKLTKTYIGTESETATGPNFVRQYMVTADIANGQTITNLDLTDVLANSMQYVSVASVTKNGAATASTAVATPSTTTPGGTLTRRIATVTGTTSTDDASMVLNFFVPRLNSSNAVIINATTGDDVTATNDGQISGGSWTPVDNRDSTATVTAGVGTPDHTLTEMSIATQKSVAVVTDTGAAGPTPGDTLEYTINFQISDYFAFQNIVVTDVISDGQRVVAGFTPTLTVNEHNRTSSGNVAVANFSTSAVSGGGCPTGGQQTETINVSNELVSRNTATPGTHPLGGRLVGGGIPDAGTGAGPLPNNPPLPFGGTTGTIKFRTTIQENFSNCFPSGDQSVDQGDVLNDDVTIAGDLLQVNNVTTPTGSSEADTSAATVTIARGQLSKTVYQINGAAPGAAPYRVRPGDTVTYRFQYTLPATDFENLVLTDYLPLPVFDVDGQGAFAPAFSTTFGTATTAAAPPAQSAKYGPAAASFVANTGITPTVTIDSTSNSVSFNFGTNDEATNPSTTIDVLLSVKVLNQPFADGLFLTNQVREGEVSTNAGSSTQDAIVQIQVTEPVLNIRKGIIKTDNPGSAFTSTAVPAGVTVGAGCPRISGAGVPVRSNNLGATFNSNLVGADQNDLVTFAIVVENTGTGLDGAFDVLVRDDLPTGLVVPAGGLNLCVQDGTGALMPFTTVGTGLLDPAGGIRIDDPGPTASPIGGLDPASNTNGRNIAIITFDLRVNLSQLTGTTITNTATLANYSSTEGGPDYTPTDLTDTATISINPNPVKSIVSTSEASTPETGTGTNANPRLVAIGEIVRYRVEVSIPEATTTRLTIQDSLPNGLRYLNDGTTTVAFVSNQTPLSIANPPAPSTLDVDLQPPAPAFGTGPYVNGAAPVTPTFVLPDANIGSTTSYSANADTYNSGTDPVFKLGNLTNADDDADAEYVVIEYNAIVENIAGNVAGTNRNNVFTVLYDQNNDGDVDDAADSLATSNATRVTVVEPSIPFSAATNNVTVTPTTVDGGDTVTYTITYTAASGATNTTAFDARILDTLPAGVTLNPGSVNVVLAGGAAGVTNNTAGGTVDVTVATVPVGATVTITFTATVSSTITPGTTITDTGTLTYTSLPGASGTAPNPTGSTVPGASGTATGERNGSGAAPNTYTGSDTAVITGILPSATKTIVGTNQPHTTGNNVAIGEIVTYQVQATIPEGTTPAAQIVDTLDAGLAFVDVVSVTSSPGVTLGSTPNNPPTNPTVTGTGQPVTFNFGTITNTNNNAAAETVTVQYRAVVLDVAGNQAEIPTLLNNSADFTFTGGDIAPVSAPDVTVVEPKLQVAIDPPGPVSASNGTIFTFTVTVSHAPGSNADAFNVDLRDVIPAGLVYQPYSLSYAGGVVPTTISDASAPTLIATYGTFPLGSTSSFVFRATVTGATVGSTITDTASATYTSLPGPVTTPQSTFSAVSTERTGNTADPGGAVNDYVANASKPIMISGGATAVALADFAAERYGKRVLLRWNTGFEASNLGFNLYREQNGERVLLNKVPVAGSAVIFGDKGVEVSGDGYGWWDDTRGSSAATTYWIEDLDTNGTSTMHGPFAVTKGTAKRPREFDSALLSDLSGAPIELSYPAGSLEGGADGASQKTAAAQDTQFALAAGNAVKLSVKTKGWYRVSQADLVGAGLDPNADPRNLQLFVDGAEVPLVVNGEADGHLDAADTVEFFGTGVDTIWTDARTYWLVAGASGGRRIPTLASVGGTQTQQNLLYTAENRTRSVYVAGILNGDASNFYGPLAASWSTDVTLNVKNMDPAMASATVNLDIVLQGTTEVATVNPDHTFNVKLNGTSVGTITFDGKTVKTASFPVPQSLLREGANTVNIQSPNPSNDSAAIDTVRVSYWHKFVADADSWAFSANGGQSLTVSGFSNAAVRVADVTDAANPQAITGSVAPSGAGFAVTFDVPVGGVRQLVAFTDASATKPPDIRANQPSSWNAATNGADMIIVANPSLIGSVEPLRALRASQGLTVAVVSTEDVYDEFGYGMKSSDALKAFFARAKATWRTKPRFVLLVGDASFDSRGFQGTSMDLVPTKLIDTTTQETADDGWLVDFDNDDVPDVAIGRLPARTAAEASAMVGKVVSYEQNGSTGGAGKRAVLFADSTAEFESAQDAVAGVAAAGATVQKIYRGQVSDSRTPLLAAINNGSTVVDYFGHGGYTVWNGNVLTSADAAGLTNSSRLAVFLMHTCGTGYFVLKTDVLAESLLKANGGAVAAWSSSSSTDSGGQSPLNTEMCRQLFSGAGTTLGEAANRAKGTAYSSDVRRSWNLLGDPSMKLK